jgi:hypothetical protein
LLSCLHVARLLVCWETENRVMGGDHWFLCLFCF